MSTQRRATSQGFAAIAAVFLLVVLAGLGAFMLSFSNTQQLTSAQDVQGARAYWAARSGLAWGLTQVTTAAASACTASSTTANLSLSGFAVAVTTSRACYSEGGATNNVSIYQIQSIASSGSPGAVNFVERSVSATLER